jgi:probable HAF family extracellular repeat protein
MKILSRISLLVVFQGVYAVGQQQEHHHSYQVVDLGFLGSGQLVSAFAINEPGDAVGRAEPAPGSSRAFMYTRGVMSDLGTLPGKAFSRAQGVNNRNQVVGWSFSDRFGSDAHAFIYERAMVDLHPLVSLGGSASFAAAINEAGHVTGDALTLNDAADHAFLLRHGSSLDLGTLGGTFSVGDAINANDQVAGASTLAGDSVGHAFVWNGGMADIECLGGSWCEALAIANDGTVAGYALLPGDVLQHAFRYRHGVLRDLHLDPLPANSAALGINNSGDIVGFASPTSSDVFAGNIAVLWCSGNAVDLNSAIAPTSGWQLYRAAAINDRGQIVGVGLHNGAVRAFMLVPKAR